MTKVTRVTSYFVDLYSAIRYYQRCGYENTCKVVKRKLREGEIYLGEPPVKSGETIILLDHGYRYGIEEL